MRLKDVITLERGFFQQMDRKPWGEVEYQSLNLDIELIGRYGNRVTSPLVDMFMSDEVLTEQGHQKLVNLVHSKYSNKWRQLYQISSMTFDPLETYNVTEEEDTTSEHTAHIKSDEELEGERKRNATGTNSNTVDRDSTDTHIKTGTDKTDRNNETTTNEEQTGTTSSDTNETATSELTFVDRKDKTLNEVDRETSHNETTEDDTTSTLTFQDRKDMHTRDLTTSVDGETTENTRTTERTNENNEATSNVYGFNSSTASGGVPANSNTAKVDSDNSTDVDGTRNNQETTTDTGTTTDSKTGTELTKNGGTTTKNGTAHETGNDTSETTKTGSEKTTTTTEGNTSGESTTTTSGSVKDNGGDVTTYNTQDETTSKGLETNTGNTSQDETGTEKTNKTGNVEEDRNAIGNRTLTRSGNTSGRTSADLLQESINFWQWNFYDVVLKDVVDMLTIPIYE